MAPEDVPTIEQILEEYGVDTTLHSESFAQLVDALKNRENVMVTEIGPLVFYRKGLDNIISQY
jgi:hypothetical protein